MIFRYTVFTLKQDNKPVFFSVYTLRDIHTSVSLTEELAFPKCSYYGSMS